MRVLILCHKDLVPPRSVKSVKFADYQIWRTEYYVGKALKRLGHQVHYCGVDKSLKLISSEIRKFKPNVVFNLLEEFSGEGLLEPLIPSYLASQSIAFTGCSDMGLILSQNKIAAKEILKSKGVPVPGAKIFPKIVKLVDEESSRGIEEGSVVHNMEQEMLQIEKLRDTYGSRVFSEEYISGRELHVGVFCENENIKCTPIWETTFGRKMGPAILTEKVKWDFDYRISLGMRLEIAKNISSRLAKKVQKIAVRAFKALEIDGYARVDIRYKDSKNIFILEVNPNPEIAFGDEFANCMQSYGYEYDQMIQLFINEALRKRQLPLRTC